MSVLPKYIYLKCITDLHQEKKVDIFTFWLGPTDLSVLVVTDVNTLESINIVKTDHGRFV